ncbi:MAG: DUF4392 domain-containing protein [SAR202 cluster bacterium]|jgi:hypothetical protein|nr:hypothetical protein [Chloroflexota bacterium]MDP6421551.1 DUF4392 domain-containing protein [SAR202 cluster bacterium]MDP6664388.1 DUF4392 domain-containing protein [SAR202 cluster bacterium]MDP6800415.1 DUF4392 domain-containing protein [SAR202 cluster bacterium]MQG57532.1 DUF4392 domain-containing protein [SAR202 cluster bacterium]|tara:strand:- start:40 stop:879 length:840 start_codon:yes stop_codon:yes gene_type:complete
MTIEDIILDNDRRGISSLRPFVPANFAEEAALLILDNPGTAIITTGFYILDAAAAETDGPPGAVAIGNALHELGYSVVYVTDRFAASLMAKTGGEHARVVEFPIMEDDVSSQFAAGLLAEIDPSIVISIERCGFTDEGLYRNMRGKDISAYNAKIDHIFTEDRPSVGIGDGGNEIGMGNLADEIPKIETLVKQPCVTRTTKLVLSSVSNWGGYGLVAALSQAKGRNLLPSIEEEQALMKKTVDLGAVDGMSAKQEYKVDGFTLEENSQTLQALHDHVGQ